MSRRGMADETLDGILFGLRLASNPKIQARNKVYTEKLHAFRAEVSSLSKDQMIYELKADFPAYILDILNTKSVEDIRDRYVNTFGRRLAAQAVKDQFT